VYRRNPLVESGTIAAYAGMPLCDGGFVLGVVSIFDGQRRAFADDELAVLRVQSRLASNILALRRSARTDTLTGLPNRALCLDNLQRTLSRLARDERGVAVMFVDVDNFKTVNDQFGHAVGDELLVRLADGMSSVLRPTDTLARYGGDEFVVVCEDVADMAEAREIAERLASTIADAVPTSDLDEPVSVSLGIALATDPKSRAEDLITAADGAMYRAKYSKPHARWGVGSHAWASSAESGTLHETAPAGAISNDPG
jgi:diguanylate cyclase (GGDEF)-like protein